MNISRINPIGYQAKTEKGNTYQKSNIGKTALIATAGLIDASPLLFKNNSFAQLFSTKEAIKGIADLFKVKIPPKMVTPLAVIGVAFDLAVGYCLGKGIDDFINVKRMERADKAAEAQVVDKKEN